MAKVGVDFGTTNSSIIMLLKDETGSLLARSLLDNNRNYERSLIYVQRTGEIKCGDEIDNNFLRLANNVGLIYNLKEKLLDENFNSVFVCHGEKREWKDTQVFNKTNDDKNIICYDKWQLLEKYMSYLLTKANKSFYLNIENDRITDVALSVPCSASADYIIKYKEAVEKASVKDCNGKVYNVKVYDIIEEPVSIGLLSYKYGNSANYLIYDMGGGTLDIAIVSYSTKIYDVIDYDGNKRAGNYINEEILRYVFEKNE